MAAPEPDPLVVAREQERALDMFVAGKDYREIAAALDRSVATAHKRVQDALHEARRLKAAEYIDVELAIYQRMQDRLMQRLETGIAPEKIAPHLRNIQKDRRALLGLDAPRRTHVQLDAPAAVASEFADAVRFAERESEVDADEIRRGEGEAS